MDDRRATPRKTRLTTRGRVVLLLLVGLALFALGMAVGGAMRREPGTPHMLTGTADVHVVTVTLTTP